MTARKTRIVRSGEVSGCSCSIVFASANGFNAGPIIPSGSSPSSNSGCGEPASISWCNRCSRSRILSGCRIDIVCLNAAGSRFKSSGTAIDCKSRIPSGVSIGEPAKTRSHHGCFRKFSTNVGANSSSLSTSSGWQRNANVSSRVCSKSRS